MSDLVWRFLTAIVVIAIIMVLVAPDSRGAAVVKDVSGAMNALVRAAVQG